MRPPAEVHEGVVAVNGDRVGRFHLRSVHRKDDLGLVGMVTKQFEAGLAGHLLAYECLVGGDYPLHLCFDLPEVIGRERAADVEVVVEAVGYRRTDGEGGPFEQVENRLGQHMSGRVPHDSATLLGGFGNDREPPTGIYRAVEIRRYTINCHCNRGCGQARTDRLGYLPPGCAAVMDSDCVVGKDQLDGHHGSGR